MRNYWLRILGGALAVFAIGMIGVSLARQGIAKVNTVVHSDEPLSIPLPFVPFMMGGERLGMLQRLVVLRDAPRQVRAVELKVDLADSLVARGLADCRLAANLEGHADPPGVDIRVSDREHGAFRCLPGDSVPPDLVEFGEAVFQPGDVRVPLFVQQELVTELREALAGDSTVPYTVSETDSIVAEARVHAAEARADSLGPAGRRMGESLGRAGRRLGDSLRAAALRQRDSLRAELGRMADTLSHR